MRVLLVVLAALVIVIGAFRPTGHDRSKGADAGRGAADRAVSGAAPAIVDRVEPAGPIVDDGLFAANRCGTGLAAAAAANDASLETLVFAPFRREETGWATYAPRIAAEIGTRCPAASPGFAAALARWQAKNGLPATGIVDVESFAAMNGQWTLQRPFVGQTRDGDCPEVADMAALGTATTAESYGGKTIQIRADALRAYRALAAAAARALPGFGADGATLQIFSGFRSPDADALRCATDGNCQGVVRAACSAHRTGLAFDMVVGMAPGFGPDSSDDTNRRFMVDTPLYRWLVRNAGRFGFVNYVFEPWHWEWREPHPPAPVARTAATQAKAALAGSANAVPVVVLPPAR